VWIRGKWAVSTTVTAYVAYLTGVVLQSDERALALLQVIQAGLIDLQAPDLAEILDSRAKVV
jgi:hypothetical protein